MPQRIRRGDVPDVIRKTAEEFAGTFYEEGRSDQFRSAGLTDRQYVDKYWHLFVPAAIEVLSSMLGMPGVDQKQKDVIYEGITDYHARSTRRMKPKLSTRRLN